MKNTRGGAATTALYIIYIGIVLFLCLYHFKDIPEISKTFLGLPIDKYIHFIMFFPYPFLGWMLFRYSKIGNFFYKPDGKKAGRFFIIIIGGFIFAVITESFQGFTTYRTADPYDLLADTFGLLVSGCLLYLFEEKIIKASNALFGINGRHGNKK